MKNIILPTSCIWLFMPRGLVEELFQGIQNTNKGIPRFPGQLCTLDHFQVLLKVVPITHGHELRVSWPVTPSIYHYEEAPCRYLGDLIGHEGEGSLFHASKILGCATGLYGGEADWSMEYSFFNVSIDITNAGHEHMQDSLRLLFKHIKAYNCLVFPSGFLMSSQQSPMQNFIIKRK